jgi:hypothetical protein
MNDKLLTHFLELFVSKQKIKVDFLIPPPAEVDKDKVSIKAHRARPKEASEIHAYLTKEAKGLEIGKIEVKIAESTVTIVSNFNYLIFKLHAFADRLNDESKDYGRHHA